MQGDIGAETLDNVQKTIAAMDAREAARIQNQGLHAERAYWLTMIAGALGTALELALVIALLVAAMRSGRDRARLQQIEAERLAALERERLARVEAERANRMKDDFLTTLSHELRTPLTAIVGWSNVLKTADLPPERARYALEAILRGAEAETYLVDSLLDLSRIGSGKMYLDKKRIDFVPVVNAAADTIRPSSALKQIQLEISTSTSPVYVVGDADRMQQIVWNLLSNAVKFTPDGGQISLKLRRDGNAAILQVSDNGRGIRAEFLPYIFDRFAQDGKAAEKHRGLGLGLAIVHALVQAHGGTIEVASPGDGQGSTFTLRFPLCKQTQPEDLCGTGLTMGQSEVY